MSFAKSNYLLYIWYTYVTFNLLPYMFTGEMVLALDSVSGRKHPSTIQIKQLKSSLPMMPVMQHFVTSQVY